MPTPWEMDRDRIGWWVIAGVLAATVGYVVYSFVGTFVFGVFVYYATRPIYRRLKRFIRPPSLAAGVSLVLIALPAILLLAYTSAIGLQEFNRLVQLYGLDVGQLETLLAPYLDVSGIVENPLSILSEEFSFGDVWQNVGEAGKYLGFLGTAALHTFVMLLLAFYLLRDDHRLATWFQRRFSDTDGVVEAYATRVDRDFSHIFFGNLLNAVLTGIIGALSYGVLDFVSPAELGIPYPALLGLLTGIASLIPVVGIKLVYVPIAGYLLYGTVGLPELLWFPLLFVVISFIIVDVIPDLVLRPYVSGRSLHLGLVMLSYIFGPLLFGWYGLFLGPMILVLVVHFATLVLPELLAGSEIVPGALEQNVLGEPSSEAPAEEQDADGEKTSG